jgi:hypothetical protein
MVGILDYVPTWGQDLLPPRATEKIAPRHHPCKFVIRVLHPSNRFSGSFTP